MNARKLGFGLVTLALVTVPVGATPLPRYGSFVFSSLCWEEESGDAAGLRLMLLRLGNGDYAFYSWSEGPLDTIAAEDVKIDRHGHIRLTLKLDPDQEYPDGKHTVEGDLSKEAFVQTVDLYREKRQSRIPRQVSLATKIPQCGLQLKTK